jgi:flagellar hook-basal body complex protein FliE
MAIEALQAVQMAGTLTAPAGMNGAQETAKGFGDWLQHEISSVNDQIVKADDGVRRLALGETDNLHQVMMNLEQAKLSFELMVQVRNKLLDAYQELMRMQV